VMIRYLSERRFNAIDASAMIWFTLAWSERNWLAVIVIAALFPLASVLAERVEGVQS